MGDETRSAGAGRCGARCARSLSDLRSSVAAQIKAWRNARAETLSSIASALGVSESTVYMWEAGERFPNPENLVGLADVLGIPPCKFFLTDHSTCCRVNPQENCEPPRHPPARAETSSPRALRK